MRLKNKVVLITGSTTGIGKSIALRCVAEGASVIIHGLERDLGEQLLAEIGSDKAALHIEDLRTEGTAQRLIKIALDRFGRLDALVNNAAMVVSGNIHTTDMDFFKLVLEVNTLAPFMLIKAALSHLERSHGCVLNIGSVNAHCGEPNLLPYSVSKGALMTMTRNLGDTLHRENGVRVNQINPGWVLTETEITRKRVQGLPDDWYNDLPRTNAPAGRILKP